MSSWVDDSEYFCKLPFVPIEKKYISSTLYMESTTKETVLAIGVIAISDYRRDGFVFQFFDDDEITELIKESFRGVNSFSEEWLITQTLKRDDKSIIFGIPFAIPADTARELCFGIKNHYEELGYYTNKIEIKGYE